MGIPFRVLNRVSVWAVNVDEEHLEIALENVAGHSRKAPWNDNGEKGERLAYRSQQLSKSKMKNLWELPAV